MSLAKTSTALGAFYRRRAMRLGKAKAITATARKLAVLVHRVLTGSLVHHDSGADAYHQLNRDRELKSLRKRAKLLGFANALPVRCSLVPFGRSLGADGRSHFVGSGTKPAMGNPFREIVPC